MEGRPWKRSRVSDLNFFFRLVVRLLTINSEADTNWFIRKSTKLDIQWVTDFLPIQGNQQISHSGNMPFNTSHDGSSARKGTMRKPLSTFAWPWTCGRASCKPLPACFDRFLLFFLQRSMFYWLFFWGEAIARGRHFITQGAFESYILLGDIFSRSLPGISVQRLLLFGPRRRGAGCNLCIFFSSDNWVCDRFT